MKRTFTFIAFLGVFAILSFSGGRAGSGDEGNTGAPGDAMNGANPKTCQFCHSTGAFGPPTMKIELYDSIGTTKWTTYRPGRVHTVRVTATATGTPVGYGFQMIDIKKAGNTPVAGFLQQGFQTASNIQIATTSAGSITPNRTYAEHRGISQSPIFNVKWKAPAVGTGAIVFYASGTAVNGNNGQGGDGATSVTQEFAEGTTSTKEIDGVLRFEVFGQGNTEGVSLLLTSDRARAVTVRVCNLEGKIVTTEKLAIVAGDNIHSIQLGAVRGAYMIQMLDNQTVITKKIIKF